MSMDKTQPSQALCFILVILIARQLLLSITQPSIIRVVLGTWLIVTNYFPNNENSSSFSFVALHLNGSR